MEHARIAEIFVQTGAIVTGGHFVYTSGRHGSAYVNKNAIYPYASLTDELCRGLAAYFSRSGIETVAAPAMGGLVLESAVARHLTEMTSRVVFGVFAEPNQEKVYDSEQEEIWLRRPELLFKRDQIRFLRGKRVLVIEDILNTGLTALRTVEAVRAAGGEVVAVGALCSRGSVTASYFDLEEKSLYAMYQVNMDAVIPKDCELCHKGIPVNTDLGHGAACA